MTKYTIAEIRNDFPILAEKIYGKPLVYFDNGATTQKPQCVIDKISECYLKYNANVHRGVHYLSNQATDQMEQARRTVQNFIGAASENEIIFTRGTTESINLVAFSFGERFVGQGDEIIVSMMEHHSNIVPWQMLCERKKAILKVIPINHKGELDMEYFKSMFSEKTRLVAVTWVSNTLGTINPVKDIVSISHAHHVPVLIDAAQAVQHLPVCVGDLDCDFLVFSGHKIYGPTGVGVLYGKEKILNQMPPYQGGGEMIKTVSFAGTNYNDLPFKFEAGTPDYVAIISLGTALEYLNNIGLENIALHEKDLLRYALDELSKIPEVVFVGTAENRTSVISFMLKNIHPYDAGMLLDKMGIAVRTGTHCTMPLMEFYKIPGTIRVSLGMYNTREEVDILVNGIKKVIEIFL